MIVQLKLNQTVFDELKQLGFKPVYFSGDKYVRVNLHFKTAVTSLHTDRPFISMDQLKQLLLVTDEQARYILYKEFIGDT